MKFQLPNLPYGHNELEPFMSADQLSTHYLKHHKGYVDKVNKAIEEQDLGDPTLEYLIHNQDGSLFDNAAQAWNHTFYWFGLTPETKAPESGKPLLTKIQKKFGGLDGLKAKFTDSATSLFGSGWTWLVATPDGDLEILNTQNADNPLRLERVRPLWTCDVWEHAYYIDVRNERKKYVEGIWSHVNWEFVERNYASESQPNMTQFMSAGQAVPASEHRY
jgi:Fe-Mn family superoxide dismutase